AEVTRDAPATVLGSVALQAGEEGRRRPGLPEGRELRRPGSVPLEVEAVDPGRVRPISTLGDAVEPLVIEDFATEPALDPVIGPELAAARTRVGLSVDELAERTRIRPHVIESIEVDDVGPCGGDFYARGHLRTRVLGQDTDRLVAEFDRRYATAPINARKVFEAELATGATGSIRSTAGGPNWALLVGVVLVLVMLWGVVRLFAAEPEETLQSPVPALNGSAGVGTGQDHARTVAPAPKPLKVTLVGAQGDSHVVVRGRSGSVAWAGELVLGEKRTVRAVPPVTVRSSDAGAVEVQVAGKHKGALGEAGQPGRRTFHRPR
ncbi:MAG: helix-turn-helix domain-containing protein, partial [Nocardioidaceae bacterium]|nr:helix-turn-helix domain-containing protein [Nocardioidaceae bacterium]